MATKKKKQLAGNSGATPGQLPAAPGYLVINREEPEILNDTANSVKIVWRKVFDIYNMLGCPKEVYNPTELPIDKAAWFVLTSERNTGKTTNLILIAMILNLKYGLISAYLRQTSDEVTPKEMRNFLNVILNNGYIQKLTNGKYNGARFWARHYTFVRWSPDGKIEEQSDPWLWVGAVTEWDGYRSTLNLPLCNMILYDEFITTNTPPDLFVGLCQLHKTIARNRSGVKMFLCANTTNYYHEFFQELIIQDEVLNTKVNNSFIKLTPIGTYVYYKRIGDLDPQREKINVEYYGFNNPKLRSITGGDWAVKNYPHLHWKSDADALEDKELITRDRHLYFMGRYYNIELYRSDGLGLFVNVRPEKDRPKEGGIYTLEDIHERREIYRFGENKLDKLLWKLYDKNKWYYTTNDVGFSVETYVERANNL